MPITPETKQAIFNKLKAAMMHGVLKATAPLTLNTLR